MNDILQIWNLVADQWFIIMKTAIVQSFGLLLIAMAVALVTRSHRAAMRFWLWQGVALKMLLLPFSLVIVIPVLAAQVESQNIAQNNNAPLGDNVSYVEPLAGFGTGNQPRVLEHEPESKSKSTLEPTPSALLFACWTIVVVIQIARCVRSKQRLNRTLAECTPAAKALDHRLQTLSRQLGIRKSTGLLVGPVQVPFVTGVIRPRIVIPLDCAVLGNRFDQVVLHELSHVKRNDLVWVWIPELARVLFFFHPLMYWGRDQANLCREMACDEVVLLTGVDRGEYANTLLAFTRPESASSFHLAKQLN